VFLGILLGIRSEEVAPFGFECSTTSGYSTICLICGLWDIEVLICGKAKLGLQRSNIVGLEGWKRPAVMLDLLLS
jgi:hypothetical protein